MAAELLHDRNRAFALAGAIGLHAIAIALLLLVRSPSLPPEARAPGLVAVPLREPPPPPPEIADEPDAQAPAPASRGADETPSPPEPPIPLASPTPAEPSVDPGSGSGSGAGETAGSGSGPGGAGSGTGVGTALPPRRLAGALTNEDYRRTRPPRGAAGTVVVSYRVRSDGAVDRCSVLRTSGYAVLDEATCRLIEQRFRFDPARDAAGRAIDWEVRTDYTWRPR
ncbi:MAG TPA: TonB family protein [Croceibacterium sp.]